MRDAEGDEPREGGLGDAAETDKTHCARAPRCAAGAGGKAELDTA